MEFNELKMIWDSQNQEPLYALNEGALQRVVQRRNDERARALSRCYTTEITVGLICGFAMLGCAGLLAIADPASLASWSLIRSSEVTWEIPALLGAAAIWFYYGAYMYLARKRQQRRLETFDSSLRGDLDRALSETDFQLMMARNTVWRGLVPVWLAAALWVAALFHLEVAPVWAYLLLGVIALIAFVREVGGRNRSITDRFEPRRRELEALRAKLADAQR